MIDNHTGFKHIGNIFGIPLFAHWNMLLELLAFFAVGLIENEILLGVFLFAAILFKTLIHELGHAFAAKYCKVEVYYIELSIFGGICSVSKPRDFKSDLLYLSGGFLLEMVFFVFTLIYGYFFGFSIFIVLLLIANFILLFIPNIIPRKGKEGRPPTDGYQIINLLMKKFKKIPYE